MGQVIALRHRSMVKRQNKETERHDKALPRVRSALQHDTVKGQQHQNRETERHDEALPRVRSVLGRWWKECHVRIKGKFIKKTKKERLGLDSARVRSKRASWTKNKRRGRRKNRRQRRSMVAGYRSDAGLPETRTTIQLKSIDSR